MGTFSKYSPSRTGLGQWTDTADGGRRHTLLLDYAKGKNKNGTICNCSWTLFLTAMHQAHEQQQTM